MNRLEEVEKHGIATRDKKYLVKYLEGREAYPYSSYPCEVL